MTDDIFDFTSPEAEIAFLRLLLHQRGLPYESADRALDTYEMMRRLSDEHERNLLLDYGYENISLDIFNKAPIGSQWSQYEETLFSLKELAVSRSRYHILQQAYKQRQQK